MGKTKLLALTALAGGAVAIPVAAHAQSTRSPSSRPAAPQPPTPAPAPGEPIIPDSQFEQQVPPLDPDINRPLEPLDQVAPPSGTTITPGSPTTGAANTTPPVPFPPVPGPVEDAPLGDPELAQPLPPLATFDVTPAQPGQQAQTQEAQPSPVRYRLETTGLTDIGLDARFRGLSALAEARGEAVNGSMIESRAREDVDLAVRLLNSEGYYDASATSGITPAAGPDGRLTVTIATVPGPRYRFNEINIAGATGEPADIAREALLRGIKPEDPIVATAVEAAEANVLLVLPQRGYPFAQLGTEAEEAGGPRVRIRDILLDPDTQHGDYSLLLVPGNKATFRNIITNTDRAAFTVEHLQLLSRFHAGQTFDRRLMDDLREATVTTRLFRSVAAEPVPTGEMAPDGSEYVDIRVNQVAGPSRSLTASAGYSTGEGLRLEGAWEDRNFFRPEGALRGALVLGTNEQSVVGRLRFNNWHLRDQALLFQAEIGRRDYAAFEGYTTRLFAQVTRESTPIWQKRWTYAYGAELLATNESQVGAPAISLGNAYFIGGLIGQLGYDASNSLLDPTRGFRVQVRLNPEASLRGDASFYLRSQLDATYYQPVGDSFTIAGRARFGSIFGIARDDLAPSRRFYSGGGGSVRGFGFQQLGPHITVANPNFDPAKDDPTKVPPTLSLPVGGRGLTEFALEGRYRFGNYGIVAFVDGGSVTPSEYPGFDGFRLGVGVGGRLYTNFGPIRVDVATPLGRRAGESLISLYISIGQAF